MMVAAPTGALGRTSADIAQLGERHSRKDYFLYETGR
jgi:hypothetical protein